MSHKKNELTLPLSNKLKKPQLKFLNLIKI